MFEIISQLYFCKWLMYEIQTRQFIGDKTHESSYNTYREYNGGYHE